MGVVLVVFVRHSLLVAQTEAQLFEILCAVDIVRTQFESLLQIRDCLHVSGGNLVSRGFVLLGAVRVEFGVELLVHVGRLWRC